METTSASLLIRVRSREDQQAWERFVELYTPLLYGVSRKFGLTSNDSADLVQEVLLHLLQKLPELEYDPGRSFRGWLKTVTLNKCREKARKTIPIVHPRLEEVVSAIEADEFSEAEHRRYLVKRALQLMQSEFEPTTWQACWEFVAGGRPAADVAASLGTSVDVVYAAKSRILRRLRQELGGLLD